MNKILLILGVLIFLVVAGFITVNITKSIFNRVAGDITGQIVGNLIQGGSSTKVEKKSCDLPKTQRQFKSEPYYSGPLIDAHVHFPTSSKIVSSVAGQNGLEMPVLEGELSAQNLICLFESEGIIKTFAFHITAKFAEGAGVSTAKSIEEAYPGKIVHFIMPPPVKSLNVDPSAIGDILNKNKGLFGGFGEVALYMDGYEGMKPDDPMLKQIYKLADEHNLIIMMHPAQNQKESTEKVLADYPQVKFLIHGGDNEGWIMELMKKYNNFYYSLDANITSIYGYEQRHERTKPTKQEWLTHIRKNFNSQLDKAVKNWKPKIESFPNRFTWGTDRWYSWHFDEEVGGILEEFGRAFIGRLDPSVQANFAYKNAEKMLQNP